MLIRGRCGASYVNMLLLPAYSRVPFSDFTEHDNFSGKLKVKSEHCHVFLLSQTLLIFGNLCLEEF